MLPREYVINALEHRESDRVPTDFWAVDEIWDKLKKFYNTDDKDLILDELGIDIRLVKPDYIGPPIKVHDDGSFFLPDGTHRKKVANQFGVYEEYVAFPLGSCKTVEELLEWDRWPNSDLYDWDSFSKKIGSKHKKYYIKLELGGPFEQAWSLRGYEQYLMDMVINPEIAHAIIKKLTDNYIKFLTSALEAAGDKIDMVYTYDDIGGQSGLLLSPDMWSEFIRPYHVEINKVIRSYGKTIMYHSCGAIRSMIPKLIELPIDVLNPLQPLAAGMSDIEGIKEEFGDQISFHGAIDIQHLLPYGRPEEVTKEAKRIISILGRGGGYILTSAHYIQADTPLENIFALYDAVK